ncbi:hypothetical protein MPTK1_1g08200 [Marchantia polymorpha subsp. ruderalis]|nr:hypothetical protein MARPO_0036s0064 [Marchantia polymorpha]BBM97771.1 hypothetical protein Mp_1g08200 [Marchantia polymorpha subsp. ruderalis]|eukprot:PTQ41074.1 hypothetical protein MARPO_0036s0064 [Marchantia polymorpha]
MVCHLQMRSCAPSELRFDPMVGDLQLDPTGFEDLPRSCIALVLCFLSPRDIAISACANRAFRGVSLSDVVWQAMLPKDYNEVLAKAKDGARAFDSKKQIFDYLCSKVLLQNHEFYWLSRSLGGVCRSQGAEALDVVWGSDDRYWDWLQRSGSSYDKSAYLKAVCWLHVKGSMECSLPVGKYTLSWRFALEQNEYGFTRRGGIWPLEFSMSVNDHETVKSFQTYLRDGQSSYEGEHSSDDEDRDEVDTDWKEFHVGDFSVEEGEKDSRIGRVKLQYSLVETRGGIYKSGLWLDGVVIMPKQKRSLSTFLW